MEPDGGWSWVPEENDTAGWWQADVSKVRTDDLPNLRFDVWCNRFKSSSPDCEAFIHDPRAAMLESRVPGVTPESKVTTLVLNHENTLSKFHLFVSATVTDDGVALSMYKVAEP